jgi:hypothetical protein
MAYNEDKEKVGAFKQAMRDTAYKRRAEGRTIGKRFKAAMQNTARKQRKMGYAGGASGTAALGERLGGIPNPLKQGLTPPTSAPLIKDRPGDNTLTSPERIGEPAPSVVHPVGESFRDRVGRQLPGPNTGMRKGAFDSSGNRLRSEGGTFSVVGKEDYSATTEAAQAQLAALEGRRTGPLYRGNGGSNEVQPRSRYMQEVEARNQRIRDKSAADNFRRSLGNLSPGRKAKAMTAFMKQRSEERMGGAKLAEAQRSNFAEERLQGAKLQQDVAAASQKYGLDVAKLDADQQKQIISQFNKDRDFELKVEKYGLDSEKFRALEGDRQRKYATTLGNLEMRAKELEVSKGKAAGTDLKGVMNAFKAEAEGNIPEGSAKKYALGRLGAVEGVKVKK